LKYPRFILPAGYSTKLHRLSVRLLLAGLVLGGANIAAGQTAPVREYQVKAVFLFNFAQFVEWPPEAFPDVSMPLIIGVLGDDPFGKVLDETVQGESIRGRILVTRRWKRAEDVDRCHILFISPSEAPHMEQILGSLAGRHILTVSDTEDFARQGGMIRLFAENKRTRLKINLDAAKVAGLVISSKLLRPAEIISGKEGTP
jgi:hypothetical protein